MLILKQSTVVTVQFGPFVDKTDGVALEVGLATAMDNATTGIRLSKNGGTLADRTDATAPAYDAMGFYKIVLDATDTGTLGTLLMTFEEAATTLPGWMEFMIMPANVWDSMFGADKLQVDVTEVSGTAEDLPTATALAAVKAETALIVTDTAEIGTAGVGLSNIGTIGTCTTVTNAIVLPTIPTDFITADGIATDALGVDAFDAAALRQLGGLLFSGTADAGGSTTTIDDAALTEADDIWTGNWVLITSGTSANQCRLIADFDAATDVLTFAPALSSAIGAGVTFEIYANAGVDVQSWLGTLAALAAPNALVAGAVDADVSALQGNVITAASVNASALDGKGNWNIGKTGYALTTADWNVGKTGYQLSATGVDDIWDETLAGHVTADTTGLLMNEWQDGGRLDVILDARMAEASIDTTGGAVDTVTTLVDFTATTRGEPAQGAPGETVTPAFKLDFMYKTLINEKTSAAALIEIKNFAATVVDHKRVIADDGTTYTEDLILSGP